MEQPNLVTIDGRKFHGVNQELSAAQDDYIMGHLRLAGALELVLSDKKPESTAEALLTQIMVSGRTHYILAGCLTEDGKKWTHEEAAKNAEVFGSITNNDDKTQMRTAIVGFVVGFFQYATAFARTSLKSSRPN
jgi:hypothetical protein